jgi:hypothetical protein
LGKKQFFYEIAKKEKKECQVLIIETKAGTDVVKLIRCLGTIR